jgi:hypothetical protein
MWMRTIVALACVAAFGTGHARADAYKAPRHHRHAHRVQYQEPNFSPAPFSPAPYDGPTLVLHPASNIACDTPYRSTRALPCDQPVWVYGNPCEIDLGLGRSRSCD